MRTKALILTAILAAAGISSTLAQGTVYSVNVVGYVSITVDNATPNWRILSNPLIDRTGTNKFLSNLIPTCPDYTTIGLLSSDGTYLFSQYLGGWDYDVPLEHGVGFFIQLGEPGSITLTFVGDVAQREESNKQLPTGLSLQGSTVPVSGDLIADMAIPGGDNDEILTLPTDQVYLTSTYLGGWDYPANVAVGEGFFFNNTQTAAHPWNRNFVVQP